MRRRMHASCDEQLAPPARTPLLANAASLGQLQACPQSFCTQEAA